MIAKEQLVFDTTDAASIADSDKVGSHTLAGDGTLIGSQNVNAQDWLNTAALLYDETGTAISDANPLAVSVKDGVNVEVDLSHVDDSVALGDGTNLFTSTTVGADIGLDVNVINASLVVTATDLDIRDLVAATDSVSSHLFDGAGTALTSTLVNGKQALDVNIENQIAVNDAALADTAIANAANTLAVADTAQDIVASPLASRKYLYVRNMANKKIYIGSTGVTAANGFPISPGSVAELRVGASVDVEFVGSTGDTPEIRTLELS